MVETSPTARRPRRRSTWRRIALQVAIGVGALAVFFWRVDVGGVLAELTRIDPKWAAGGLAVFTASKVLHAWRWWSFLGERAAGVAPLAGIFLVGNMANSLLPLRAGDLLRVEVPSRRFGIPRSTLVSSVFVVESVLDLFAFAVLLVVALLLADLPPVLQPLVWSVGVAAILLFVALVGLARGREALVPLTARLLRPLPDRAGAWIAERIPPFVDGMNSLRTNVQAARVVAVSLAAWLVEVVVYWMMAHAFGIELGISQALILMIAANLVVSLPITPWSVGPYELAVTEALVVLGAGRTEAAAFALGSHLMLQAWIVLTGVIAMLALRLGPRDLLPRGDEGIPDAGERPPPPPPPKRGGGWL